MNIEDSIQQHTQERDIIKSRMYDMEKRVVELNVIIASLEEAKKLTEKAEEAEENKDEG